MGERWEQLGSIFFQNSWVYLSNALIFWKALSQLPNSPWWWIIITGVNYWIYPLKLCKLLAVSQYIVVGYSKTQWSSQPTLITRPSSPAAVALARSVITAASPLAWSWAASILPGYKKECFTLYPEPTPNMEPTKSIQISTPIKTIQVPQPPWRPCAKFTSLWRSPSLCKTSALRRRSASASISMAWSTGNSTRGARTPSVTPSVAACLMEAGGMISWMSKNSFLTFLLHQSEGLWKHHLRIKVQPCFPHQGEQDTSFAAWYTSITGNNRTGTPYALHRSRIS